MAVCDGGGRWTKEGVVHPHGVLGKEVREKYDAVWVGRDMNEID